MEPILDCSVLMLFCRLVTALAAFCAAVAAADALAAMSWREPEIELTVLEIELSVVERLPSEVEMPVIEVPHADMFLRLPVMTVRSDADAI